MKEQSKQAEIKNIERAKATYHKPKLTIYGNIKSLTLAVGTTSATADKPGGGTNKTM
jgi:hypothetical protein